MNIKFSMLLSLSFFLVNRNQLQAQNKIGYISIQELVYTMPEFKTATTNLNDYEKALVQQGQDNQAEFSRQDSIFKIDSLKWNESVKEVKRRELNVISLKMINFNQEAQQLMNKKEQDLLAPIQAKALETAKAVAKENGYSYVLSKEQLIAFPVTDDILPLVLKKLNIIVPPNK